MQCIRYELHCIFPFFREKLGRNFLNRFPMYNTGNAMNQKCRKFIDRHVRLLYDPGLYGILKDDCDIGLKFIQGLFAQSKFHCPMQAAVPVHL